MRFVFIGGCLVVLAATVFWNAGRWLVLDGPERSDVILVVDGSIDNHFATGFDLFRGGFGKQLVITENVDHPVFGDTRAEFANRFIRNSLANLANRIEVCQTRGDLVESALQVIGCIPKHDVQRILLVTSDYKTRRTLSIFKRLIPEYRWSVAASEDPSQFGYQWWRNRQSAAHVAQEWSQLLWWNCIERWQKPNKSSR